MKTSTLQMFNATIKYHDDVIFIKPFCDFFGIQYDNQTRRINSNPLLKRSVLKNTDMLLFGDERPRLTLTKQGFTTWILQLNVKIVHVSLREKLIEYQTLIFDFLFGKVEREEEIKVVVQRRDKLKRLKSIISSELNACQDRIENYISGRFNQAQLQFSQPKSISE
ncbi:MAG: phage antirepressor N-terminal domain-containing protein [Cyclobacteriaceae bacterium]|nr:phage antirepressor N-terminal domain-containing protein [Cyclobacteriaceae bacterium]